MYQRYKFNDDEEKQKATIEVDPRHYAVTFTYRKRLELEIENYDDDNWKMPNLVDEEITMV